MPPRRTTKQRRRTKSKSKKSVAASKRRRVKRVTKRRAERPGPPQSAAMAHPSDTARGNDGRMYHIAFRRRKTGKRYKVWVPFKN